MARQGRPVSDNPKEVRVEIRMTKEELKMLEFCCNETGRTRSDFLREAINRRYTRLSARKREEQSRGQNE